MNIPKELWNSLILVPNREEFLKDLESGVVGKFFFNNSLSKTEVKDLVSKGWKVIRFGLNCAMPH